MPGPVIDIDSHIWENLPVMAEYLDPKYRHLAMTIQEDDRGLEYMTVEGRKPHNLFLREGRFGRMAAGKTIKEKRDLYLKPGAVTYQQGLVNVPASHQPGPRVQVLDEEGIDTSFIYPTLGLHWETDVKDPSVAAAYARAYNDYIYDFCSDNPDRLQPIAHITLLDIEQGTAELRRMTAQGVKAALISGFPLNGRSYGDPAFDPFWAALEELQIPVTLHVVGGLYPFYNPNFPNTSLESLPDDDIWYFILQEPPAVHLGFGTMIAGRVFDRFPDLKVVLLETGSAWMLYWFERMDGILDAFPGTNEMSLYPTEYFKRQVWTSMDPDEELAPLVVERFGSNKFMWGADFPHSEGMTGAVGALKESLGPLPAIAQDNILGLNAIELYQLSS